jgi:hypothetical protein
MLDLDPPMCTSLIAEMTGTYHQTHLIEMESLDFFSGLSLTVILLLTYILRRYSPEPSCLALPGSSYILLICINY